MTSFQLATISINQTPLDWKGNQERILAALDELASTKQNSPMPDAILFPELSVSGYGCEDAFHSLDVTNRAYRITKEIAKAAYSLHPEAILFLGLPLRHYDTIYNAVAVLYEGMIQAFIPKQNLAGDGVHYEPRWFTPFRESEPVFFQDHRNRSIPIGPYLLEFKGIRIAIEICEDSWVSKRPAQKHIEDGIDLLLNPSASHFAMGKQETRRNIVIESSRALTTTFAMVNLLGNEAGRMIYDGGCLVASNGNLIYESERFSFQDYKISSLSLDVDVNRVHRGRIYSYKNQDRFQGQKKHSYNLKIEKKNQDVRISGFQTGPKKGSGDLSKKSSGSNPVHQIERNGVTLKARPHPISGEEEFTAATTLGLYDYMRKSRSRGFVLSLSGGADSATCAVLVYQMVLRAVKELGPEHMLKKGNLDTLYQELKEQYPSVFPNRSQSEPQNHSPDKDQMPQSSQEASRIIARHLLTTVYQKSENSSEITRSAASRVASVCNSNHFEVDVSSMIHDYSKKMESILERKLSWEKDDLALQNIQARARAPMAWYIANTFQQLLITTSNRSEAAVGYCTMDGDTSGGIAPVAGVSKDFILQYLNFMENTGTVPGGPMPELSAITQQSPTAELRPLSSTQTDETDLMPYPILDRIEKMAVRDRKSPLEVYYALKQTQPEVSPEKLKEYISRYFRLWSQNQWKRERYAPSFHLDDENLDPRTWYRFPILSGGYRQEIEEMMNCTD